MEKDKKVINATQKYLFHLRDGVFESFNPVVMR